MKGCTVFVLNIVLVVFTQEGCSRQSALDSSLRQKAYPFLLPIVTRGGHRGLKECKEQFKNEIWNCPLGTGNTQIYKKLPIFFKRTLPHATRETAFVHAISAAAITHEITNQCRQDKIPGCACATINKLPRGNGDWQWGGCSDNIKFGENETRRFIDSLEKGNDARTAFNLHNNEVGRKVVRGNLGKECKCHGLTGSCQLRTCWKRLAPFNVVGSELKQRYLDAVQVSFKERRLQETVNKKYRPVNRRDKKLVYLELSPDYCLRNLTVGSPGVVGRTCSSEDVSTNDCKALCNSCKLRHQTAEKYKEVNCRCKVVWCCEVKCETCTKTYSVTTCRRR